MSEHNLAEEAQTAAYALGIDFNHEPFTLDDLSRGMKVEYEHGKENPVTNITNDDPMVTAKIALAHLYEKRDNGLSTQYDYYDGLSVVEHAPAGYWRGVNPSAYWLNKKIGFYIVLILLLVAITQVAIHFDGNITMSGSIWFVAAIGLGYLLTTWK